MRNGQNNNKRMRGRNRSKGGHHHQNPLSRVYESNGQDVKIRGTASHIAEKYLQLARDAQSSGDSIASENYYQHAEHYFRLIAAAQEQLRQTQPYFQQQPGGNSADDGYDDGDEQPQVGEPYAPQAQPFYPREQQQPQQQHFQPQPQPQQPQSFQPRSQQQPPQEGQGDVDRLPSFITGGQGQPQHSQGGNGQDGNGQNGYEGSADRFPLHRRRRRHRGGPRDYASEQGGGNDGPAQAGADSADE
ncbi:MAG: DUF4167 domain-containing protein [Xanthobacteraceae bacterium]